MRLTVLALVAGVALGLAAGGRLRRAAAKPLRWPWLVAGAVALYWSSSLFGAAQGAVVALGCSYLALIAFAVANLRLVGMAVVLVGLLLNLAVVVANGAMPVDAAAVVAAGVADPGQLGSLDLGPARQWQEPGDRLAALGDVVPVAPLNEVVSFGDLIMAAGLGNVAFRLLRPSARRGAARAADRGRLRDRTLSTFTPRSSPAR